MEKVVEIMKAGLVHGRLSLCKTNCKYSLTAADDLPSRQRRCGAVEAAMYHVSTVPLSELNQHFICGLCFGYIIDATTIIECPHSCKSAINYVGTKMAFCMFAACVCQNLTVVTKE